MNNRDYPNSGILFDDDRKRGEHDPKNKSNADVTCPHCSRSTNYWVNGWRKLGRRSGEFLSLSFRRKNDTEAEPQFAQRAQDDIPFPRR